MSGLELSPQPDKLKVPIVKNKVSLIRPIIGAGLTRLTDDFIDFKVDGNTLLIENDSKLRSELLTGALYKVYEFKSGRTIDIAMSLEFAEGGKSVLDGVFFGLGFGITKAIEVVGGVSIGRGKELSFGFQRAMGQHLMAKQSANPDDPKYSDLRFVNGVLENPKQYDGVSLVTEGINGMMGGNIFPGSPIVDSFNTKLSIGFVVPLDFWKQLKKAREDK